VAVRPLNTTARECVIRLYDYPGPCLSDPTSSKALFLVRSVEGGLFVVLSCGVVEGRPVELGYGSRAILVRLLIRRASSQVTLDKVASPKGKRGNWAEEILELSSQLQRFMLMLERSLLQLFSYTHFLNRPSGLCEVHITRSNSLLQLLLIIFLCTKSRLPRGQPSKNVIVMFLPVIYRQALLAPGEALSAMGIEK
jgi:hypothetical protein